MLMVLLRLSVCRVVCVGGLQESIMDGVVGIAIGPWGSEAIADW